jgi:hypothetical protein
MHSLLSSVVERVTSNDEVSRSNRLGGKTNAYPFFSCVDVFEARNKKRRKQTSNRWLSVLRGLGRPDSNPVALLVGDILLTPPLLCRLTHQIGRLQNVHRCCRTL